MLTVRNEEGEEKKFVQCLFVHEIRLSLASYLRNVWFNFFSFFLSKSEGRSVKINLVDVGYTYDLSRFLSNARKKKNEDDPSDACDAANRINAPPSSPPGRATPERVLTAPILAAWWGKNRGRNWDSWGEKAETGIDVPSQGISASADNNQVSRQNGSDFTLSFSRRWKRNKTDRLIQWDLELMVKIARLSLFHLSLRWK